MTPTTEYSEVSFYDQRALPRVPAVYQVWAKSVCLYVGRASNLFRRWANGHHVAVRCVSSGADTIRWEPVLLEEIEEREASRIAELRPILNSTSGTVKPIRPDGCITVEQFDFLVNLKPSPDAYRLCARIMASANFGGLVNKSNEEYAREIGIDKSRVSRLIGKLHDAGVIHRIGPRSIFINPAYLFRGNAKAQNEAVKQWSELRRPKLVDCQRKTA